MGLFPLILLALVQGITEFLPISSSAHLILAPDVAGFADQGPLIDVMAHLGSLMAVIVYFRRDIAGALAGAAPLLRGEITSGGRLALLIAAATPPVMVAGGVLYVSGLVDALRSPAVIAWATLVFAAPLWLADHFCARTRTADGLSWRDAVLIGLAQMLALVPGASRSGVTMTAGRALGLDRSESARFSMLMAIPVIAAFGLLAGLELARGAAPGADLADGLVVAGLSFVAALAAIAALMRFVDRVGFLPFVIYRVGLAAAIFILIA
ncbi:undecaprenyl-diphosphatase [Marinicauda salina]|uniref:Undecaprenyl-diphosphatase n=1 Tax=Marinicauda salina TaxID=2135793 RepID=A0A2U2BWL0_9PROT|nr:undecaprenyl-diphosphate phosphatase [Marinicauda salina]PWE18406.1 undecaprenyl-diphosphatase [Marinicauda salina]